MRILYVHEQFGAFGGAETNVLATATELKRRGHEVALLHRDVTGRAEAQWRETFALRFQLGAGPAGPQVTRILESFHPHTVFLHKMADLGVVEALTHGTIPVVRMVHDHDLYCMRGYKYNPLSRRVCTRAASPFCLFPCGASVARNHGAGWPVRWIDYGAKQREIRLNRRFHRLIVASNYMREELLRNGFVPERIETHAPVPPQSDQAETSSFGPRNRIVYAGQIIRGKGVDVLLEALARVVQPFECLILGEGGHRPACEALSRRLGLEDRVHFRGFVSPAEIAVLYREATLAVMSSVWPEPFGAVGLEAMRCGLPVVAFDAGGIREWLHDGVNGFMVPWMDRARFAGRVDELLADKALARRLGAEARRWAEDRFNFSGYVRGLEDLFLRVIEAPASTAASAPL